MKISVSNPPLADFLTNLLVEVQKVPEHQLLRAIPLDILTPTTQVTIKARPPGTHLVRPSVALCSLVLLINAKQ